MGKWTELARQLSEPLSDRDNSDVSAISPTEAGQSAPNVTNVTNVTSPLPHSLAVGLRRLQAMPAPGIARPEIWPEIVADALRLASEGWAQQALALGWEPLQLFGWSSERDGVAVWLAGGVPMFTADSCMVRVKAGKFRCMDSRPMPGAIPLWELGK